MSALDDIRSALAKLKVRLGAGEIDEGTYDRLKEKLLADLTPAEIEALGMTPTPRPRRRVGPRGAARTKLPDLADLDLEAGTVLLGQFRIRRELGHGGFGAVFEAEDIHLGKALAVKVLDPRKACREELLGRFRREVGVMRELAHRRIVRVYDYREDPGQHVALISMELVRGGSVRDLLAVAKDRGCPVPAGLALTILGQTLEALAAAHARGVVHRDVTPGNILLSGGPPEELLDDPGRDPAVKLVDFGIAGLVERSEISGISQAMGTTGYAAPELSDPDAPVTPAADCYGAAAVCYHLLTGARPGGRFEPPSEFREELPLETDGLILALLDRTPERRPTPEEASRAALHLAERSAVSDLARRRARELAEALEAAHAALQGALDEGRVEAVSGAVEGASARLRETERFLREAAAPPPSFLAKTQRGLEELEAAAAAWLNAAAAAGRDGSRSRELVAELSRAGEAGERQALRRAVNAAREHLGTRPPSAAAEETGEPPAVLHARNEREELEGILRTAEARLAALDEHEAEQRRRRAETSRMSEELSTARGMLFRAEQAGDERAARDWAAYSGELLLRARELVEALAPQGETGLETAMDELVRQLGETRSWLAVQEAERGRPEREAEGEAPEGELPPAEPPAPARGSRSGWWWLAALFVAAAALLWSWMEGRRPLPPASAPAPTATPVPSPTPRPTATRLPAWPTARPAPVRAAPRTGAVVIRSGRAGDTVWIDGETAGQTPLNLRLRAGNHEIRVAREGCRGAEHWLRLGAGDFRELRLEPSCPTPTPTPQPARRVEAEAPGSGLAPAILSIRTSRRGDALEVDGKPAGTTPAEVSVAPGRHRIRVSRESYQDTVRWIEVGAGQRQELNLVLVRARPTPTPSAPPLAGKAGELSIQTPLKIRFRRVPPGVFTMGSPPNEAGRYPDEAQHRVVITRGFWMMETEVTQSQWKALMGNDPASFRNCGGRCPVENVSWYDAVRFTNALSRRAGLALCYEIQGANVRFQGLGCPGYRLPTESEWEHAARAGQRSLFAGGSHLEALGWYRNNSAGSTHPAGVKTPNTWGLRDLSGNVWEWCWDAYRSRYPDATVRDPLGPPGSSGRVLRGGAWSYAARDCRVAARLHLVPGYKSLVTGFRCVRSIP